MQSAETGTLGRPRGKRSGASAPTRRTAPLSRPACGARLRARARNCAQARGGGRRNWKGETGRCRTSTGTGTNAGRRAARLTARGRTCHGTIAATAWRSRWASRDTSRLAITATGGRAAAGAAVATRSAHSAVVTATTARTCRVARIMPKPVGPHVDGAPRARQADQLFYVGRTPGVSRGIFRLWPGCTSPDKPRTPPLPPTGLETYAV